MPNFIENTLIVRGDSKVLKYFYERNRVSKEDIEMLGLDKDNITELSLEKCIPSVIKDTFINFLENNFILNNLDSEIDSCKQNMFENHIHRLFWGTKSDVITPICYLDNIENNSIKYTFKTNWFYPFHWLINISKMFRNLDFELTYYQENDCRNIRHVYHYKNGIQTFINRYSICEKEIDDFELKELVENFLEILQNEIFKNEKGNFISYLKYYWLKNDDMDTLFINIYEMDCKLYEFIKEYFENVSGIYNSKLYDIFSKKINEIMKKNNV